VPKTIWREKRQTAYLWQGNDVEPTRALLQLQLCTTRSSSPLIFSHYLPTTRQDELPVPARADFVSVPSGQSHKCSPVLQYRVLVRYLYISTDYSYSFIWIDRLLIFRFLKFLSFHIEDRRPTALQNRRQRIQIPSISWFNRETIFSTSRFLYGSGLWFACT
jgi:hypothetical protein